MLCATPSLPVAKLHRTHHYPLRQATSGSPLSPPLGPPPLGPGAPSTADPPSPQPTTSPSQANNIARSKPPLIYVCNANLDTIIPLVTNNGIDKKLVTLKQNDPNNLTIHTTNLDICTKILDICKANNIKLYTYTPKSHKLKNIILKGLHGSLSPEDLKKEIEELKLSHVEIHKIRKITFNRNNPDIYHYLIQLSHDSSLHELTKVKSLAYQKVYWEPLRKNEIFQCTNCQRLGHASSNCKLDYRCVKCKDKHEPGQCKIPKSTSDKNQLYCVNCRETGHPASNGGCPFLFAMEIKKNNVNQRDNARVKNVTKINGYVASQGSTKNLTPLTPTQPPHHPPRHPTLPLLHPITQGTRGSQAPTAANTCSPNTPTNPQIATTFTPSSKK